METTVTVTFPIEFAQILFAFSAPIDRNSSSQNSAYRYMYDLTNLNFKYRTNSDMNFVWIAEGY